MMAQQVNIRSKKDFWSHALTDCTGFHASTAEEYATGFATALSLPREEIVAMRNRAQKSALRFTEKKFAAKWIQNMQKLVDLQRQRN
jgi:alpha-1,2-mannosyltransferase